MTRNELVPCSTEGCAAFIEPGGADVCIRCALRAEAQTTAAHNPLTSGNGTALGVALCPRAPGSIKIPPAGGLA